MDHEPGGCCAPRGARDVAHPAGGDTATAHATTSARDAAHATLITLPATTFLMGNVDEHAIPSDGEAPVRRVTVDAHAMDAHAVTTQRFADFVAATGYATTAEQEGWSFVFGGFLPDDFPPTRAVAQAPWWRQVFGADWAHPEGPQSDLEGREDHPVVHVSRHDAEAYCAWAGLRLPTEA